MDSRIEAVKKIMETSSMNTKLQREIVAREICQLFEPKPDPDRLEEFAPGAVEKIMEMVGVKPDESDMDKFEAVIYSLLGSPITMIRGKLEYIAESQKKYLAHKICQLFKSKPEAQGR